MTNIGPENQQPIGQPAGAAPERDASGRFVANKPSEGAAPTGNEEMVPKASLIAAVEGETKNTAKARDDLSRMKAMAEIHGWTFGEDGSMNPPAWQQQPQQPQYQQPAQQNDPLTVAKAKLSQDLSQAEYSADPVPARAQAYAEYTETVSRTNLAQAGQQLAPAMSIIAEQFVRSQYREDPDVDIYAADAAKALAALPMQYWNLPDTKNAALAYARGQNFQKLVERDQARRTGKPVPGSFTERPAGASEHQAPPSFDPTTVDWANRQGFSSEEIAAAAKLRAEGRGAR